MRQIDGCADRPTGRGSFGDGYGASHCNHWGLCGIVVRKCVIKLLFWVVSGVSPSNGVLDGGTLPRGRGGLGFFGPLGNFLVHLF